MAWSILEKSNISCFCQELNPSLSIPLLIGNYSLDAIDKLLAAMKSVLVIYEHTVQLENCAKKFSIQRYNIYRLKALRGETADPCT
jgi:hypothetical protein